MEACTVFMECRNSLYNATPAHVKCALCRLAPGNEGFIAHYWSPTKDTPIRKHPLLQLEKLNAKRELARKKLEKKRNRDTKRVKVSRQAVLAERRTERNIIHATRNSGRRNRDGDHVAGNLVTLDTKHQSGRENPVVHIHELEKVRSDATRAGYAIGGLVLRTKRDVGVVVFREDDFAQLMLRVTDEPAK